MRQAIKLVLLLCVSSLSVLYPVSAYGAKAVVNVNVHSSSSGNGENSQSSTDIVIESNGERKEYHSNEPGSVDISLGGSSVNVNNNSTIKVTPQVTSTTSKTTNVLGISDKKEELSENKEEKPEKKKGNETKDKKNGFWEFLTDFFLHFFRN